MVKYKVSACFDKGTFLGLGVGCFLFVGLSDWTCLFNMIVELRHV